MKLIFTKGPSLHARLLYAFVIAFFLMFADSHFSVFIQLRSYLDTIISPFYYIANTPQGTFVHLTNKLDSREMLTAENKQLREQLLLKNNDLLLLSQLQQENSHLRQLLGSPIRQDDRKMVTQVIAARLGPYNYQIVIDKGKSSGVYEGQPVLDDKGVVGQIYSVGLTTSRVILICDPLHGLPTKSLRSDEREVVLGNGCDDDPLLIDFQSNNADLKVGDTLVTSGLDGRFPEGYPVAKVTSIKDDPQQGKTVVTAEPTADLQKLRYLLLLWNDQEHQPIKELNAQIAK